MPTIEKMLKAAHASNLVHFPNALLLVRRGDNWTATVLKSGEETAGAQASHSGGKTPEEAIANLGGVLMTRLNDAAKSKERDAQESRNALADLRDGGEE